MIQSGAILDQIRLRLLPHITSDRLLPPRAIDCLDGLCPLLRVVPKNDEEIAQVLGAASQEGWRVLPVGGGTHQKLGDVAYPYEICLDMSQLNQILDYQPEDLVVTVQAGMTWQALTDHLYKYGQRIPLEVANALEATVGGVLSVNASGPQRHAYGTARDWLVGLQVVTPEGAIMHTGGKVVKNVAGYDLNKLYIGALGTLGVITSATFKVAPRPEQELLLAYPSEDVPSLFQVYGTLKQQGVIFSSLEIISPPEARARGWAYAWHLIFILADSQTATEELLKRVGHVLGMDPAALIQELVTPYQPPSGDVLFKGTMRPGLLRSTFNQLQADMGLGQVPLSLGMETGVVRIGAPLSQAKAAMSALRSIFEECGGSFVVEEATTSFRRDVSVWGSSRSSWSLMQKLKAELDPTGTMVQGRFVARI